MRGCRLACSILPALALIACGGRKATPDGSSTLWPEAGIESVRPDRAFDHDGGEAESRDAVSATIGDTVEAVTVTLVGSAVEKA
jgi:hypothetical protein